MSHHEDFPMSRPVAKIPWLAALTVIFFALAFVAGGYFVYRHWLGTGNSGVDPSAELRPASPRGELPGAEKERTEILARVKPSVAFITTFDVRRDFDGSDLTAV